MKNIKKSLSLVMLLIFACTMLVFGCGDKYANLKVTTDAPETGISLFLGKDTPNNILSEVSFTATVSGAGEGVSTSLKYRFSTENIVNVVVEKTDEQTKFTLTATNYGSTTMTIFTEEGNKSTTVNIQVIKEVEQLNLNTSYKPFIFAGSSAILDTAKAINFYPEDTSQKEVTYQLVGNYQGVTVEQNGRIIATDEAPSGSFNVVATSVDNPSISSSPISVRVFKPILEKDITISYSDNKESLTLATSVIPAEVTKMVTFTIDTQENYIIDDVVVESNVGELVETEKFDNNNFKITGINAGSGVLKFYLALVDGNTVYQNTKLEILVPVVVKQYATSIKLNGNAEEVTDVFLYDTYQNQHGEKFQVIVGEENAEDKRFVIALNEEDLQKITIVDSSNNEIKPYTENGNYDVLDNNTTVFIRIKEGYTTESTATINFLAYGTFGLICEPTSNSIQANLKHGVKQLVINTSLKTYEELYLLGIDTNTQDDNYLISVEIPKDQFTSYIKTRVTGDYIGLPEIMYVEDTYISNEQTIFDFVINGKTEGVCNVEFIAENGVATTLKFRVYKKINAFQVTSETINQNTSIGEVRYDTEVTTYNDIAIQRNSLSKIAIGLNGEVKLGIIPIYFDGTKAYNVDTKYLVSCKVTGSDCVAFLSSNTLVAKKLTDEPQTITVSMSVFCETGELKLPDQTIVVEVFYEIKEVFLDTTYIKLYTYDDLALADKNLASHDFKLYYNDGTKDIQIAENILWQKGGQDQGSIQLDKETGTVTALSLQGGRSTGLATLTAIYVKYGRTYIVQANIEIIKAERITNIFNLTYTKDNKTNAITKQSVLVSETFNGVTGEIEQKYEEEYYIYLDARNGIAKNSTFTLGQTIEPSDAYNKTLIYKVENAVEEESVPVLYIDQSGKVTINRTGGTAFIYISAKDSELQDGSYAIEKRIFVKIADGNSSVTALEISNGYDLLAINNNKESLTKFYHLTKDINLSNITSTSTWTPIGIIDGEVNEFSGNINGKIVSQGETYICTISGFNINLTTEQTQTYYGLFAILSQNAVINNLNIAVGKVAVDVTASDAQSAFTFGGLCAINNGSIKNVSVDYSRIDSQIIESSYNSNLGGIVGINNGTIYNCYVSGTFNHTKQNSLSTSTTNVGGLVALNNASIDGNSKLVNDKTFADAYTSLIKIDSSYFNINNVKTYDEISGSIAVGGVVGQNNNTVINCSFDGSIKTINNVGGIVGKNIGALENCFASGHVNGFKNVGGLAGYSENGSINFSAVNMFDDYETSYDGDILPNIVGRNDNIGGLVGSLMQTPVSNCYVKTYFVRDVENSNYVGDIVVLTNSPAENIGGLIGLAQGSLINNSFSQVNINTSQLNSVVGGLVGSADNIEIANCYTMGRIILKDKLNSFAGKMIGVLKTNSSLTTSYSTIVDTDINTNHNDNFFVGKINASEIDIQNSFHLSNGTNNFAKTTSELQNISTYTNSNWSIGTDLSSNNIWYINANNNNGHPMLVINNNKLSIEAPTSIQISLNSSNKYMQKFKVENNLEGYDGYAIIWRNSTSSSIKIIDEDFGLFSNISVYPNDAGEAYNITSSDESILRITGRNSDRLIPVSNGVVTLTITSRLNNSISARVKIYVVNKIENFAVDKESLNSLVNQKQIVGVSANNTSNYRLKITITSIGENKNYLNINNLTTQSVVESYVETTDNFVDIPYINRLYIHSTKSITEETIISVTPYIVVNNAVIELKDYTKDFTYSSYYGIKDFTCNLTNIDLTENDSARLVYTVTGDDLRLNGTNTLPNLNIVSYIGNSLETDDKTLSFILTNKVAYSNAGDETTDYSQPISKIVYEYIVKVNKTEFKGQNLNLVVNASISIVENQQIEGTFADAVTRITVNKQQLKNIGVEFFTDSYKIKNSDGEEEFTINEASSHQIIAGRTGLLKVSLYPYTAEIKEVRVYSIVTGASNISMSQLLKRSNYQIKDDVITDKISSYSYIERKPYAISLVNLNGLVLWNESNIDKGVTNFDGTYYVGFTIPSSVTSGTTYNIFVEADIIDGDEVKTIVQSYDLFSDIPSELSISYTFEQMQTLTSEAYVAYNVDHTFIIKVSKISAQEKLDGSGIKDLTLYAIINDGNEQQDINLIQYNKDESELGPNSSDLRFKFNVNDTTITKLKIYAKMQKVVNNQLTTFKSNEITFYLRDFVIKSLDIVTDSLMSDTLALATNNSKQLKVVLDAQYFDSSLIENATETQIQLTAALESQIANLQQNISKDLNSWKAKQNVMGEFESFNLAYNYPNFNITQPKIKDKNGNTTEENDYIKLQPIKASSGDEIYVSIALDYNDIDGETRLPSFVGAGVNDQTGFNGSKQTLISKVTTNFYRDISAKNSIPVGNLQNDNLDNPEDQSNTKVGEINFEDIQNGTIEGKLYYRLKEDITLNNYTPLKLSYVEVDGNGYTITINSFSEDAIASGNLGLFDTTDENTVLSNIKVKYTISLTNIENKTIAPLDYVNSEIVEPELINFGGLVANNSGIIYNCQVVSGTVEVKTLANAISATTVYVGGLVAQNSGTISFSQSSLNINVNKGIVGGLVAENIGKISNSKVILSGRGIENTATIELSNLVGGFVARNSGKIYGSYVSGVNLNGYRYTDEISSFTPIAGFVNVNRGDIYNSYSNIKVICQTRSSGFVYENSGTISSCYSASNMQQNSSAHNPFTGVSEQGVNNTGTIADCYYLNEKQGYNFGSTSQDPALKLNEDELKNKKSFAGFVFAEVEQLNGNWYMGNYGPILVDANLSIVSEQNYNELVVENGSLTYSWTYKVQDFTSGKKNGDNYNFRTITDFEQFNNYFKSNEFDYFVLLCDIVCDDYVTPQSAELSFNGTFIGNNMTLSNLYLKASNTNTNQYFGLFGQIAGATVKDLTIKAKQTIANNTSYVGILAGHISDSNITNISVDGSSVYVQGKYFVGGIAGFVEDSTIRKINVATTVNASYRGDETYANVYDSTKQYNYTYSGVAVGILTGSSLLKDVTVTGNSIAIGYYASACVGLVDSEAILSLARVQIDPNQYVRAYYVAGGVVAENRGIVDRCSIEHESNVQNVIDNTNTVANRNLTFFVGSPQIIGGLVGFNNGGMVDCSYSKLDVRVDTLATKVAGGLVGTIISGTITNCYATGSVISRRVIGGLIGSVTQKSSICFGINVNETNPSAVFDGQDGKINDDVVNIKNVFASNRWLTGASYQDPEMIASAFQKGLIVGCFNRDPNNANITAENWFVNTQVTQNTTKTDIDNYVKLNSNSILVAFNNGNAIKDDTNTSLKGNLTDEIIKELSCGKITNNFDGSDSGNINTLSVLDEIKFKYNDTYITYYYLLNFDANMNFITDSDKINAPSKGVSIYPTIARNINIDNKEKV